MYVVCCQLGGMKLYSFPKIPKMTFQIIKFYAFGKSTQFFNTPSTITLFISISAAPLSKFRFLF